MKVLIILVLTLFLALGSGCQQAVRSPYGMQQRFYAAVKAPGLAADQAIRSAHYFKIAGRRDLALRELSAAVALNPNNARLLNALGACYDEMGDYVTAQQIFNQSLTIDPDNAAALNNLGHSYYLAGKLEQAETTLQAALAKDPNNKYARNNLGLVWCKLGKNDQALRLWKKIDGEAQARDKMASVLASLGKPLHADAAPKTATTAIVLAPAALTPKKAAVVAERRNQTPELAESSRPPSEPAQVEVAKVSAPPLKTREAGTAANISIQLTAMAEKSSPEAIPEYVAPTLEASTPEMPSKHSRAKIITVASGQKEPF